MNMAPPISPKQGSIHISSYIGSATKSNQIQQQSNSFQNPIQPNPIQQQFINSIRFKKIQRNRDSNPTSSQTNPTRQSPLATPAQRTPAGRNATHHDQPTNQSAAGVRVHRKQRVNLQQGYSKTGQPSSLAPSCVWKSCWLVTSPLLSFHFIEMSSVYSYKDRRIGAWEDRACYAFARGDCEGVVSNSRSCMR